MNIVLCGMMGSGKTTIGIKIAEITVRRWYDTDGVIVRMIQGLRRCSKFMI